MFRTVQALQFLFGGGAQADETLDSPEECEPRGEPPDDDRDDADELGYDLLRVSIDQVKSTPVATSLTRFARSPSWAHATAPLPTKMPSPSNDMTAMRSLSGDSSKRPFD
jgi:hypothetical protein